VDQMDQLVTINGAVSEQLTKMEEVQKRLQAKEAKKARELLTLAGGLTHFDALLIVRADIEKKINGSIKR